MTSKVPPKILTDVRLDFPTLSHISLASEINPLNELNFVPDINAQNPPMIDATVKDPAEFIAVLQGFFTMFIKGLLYKPSQFVTQDLDRITTLMAKRDRDLQWYNELFSFMDQDPDSLSAGMDPLLTVRNGICYLEAFDKAIDRCATLRLNSGLWKDGASFSDGSARINITPEFIRKLSSLNAKDPIRLFVGSQSDSSDNSESVPLRKTFKLGLEDVRALLTMQGSSALSTYHVDMVRIDFFNVLRTLRMNKARTHESFGDEAELSDLIFHLEPGSVPRIEIEPWGIELPCDTDVYTGKRMSISVGRNRRKMLPLNHFLPYMTQASFTLFENNLHYCVDVGNDNFQCSMVFSGFSPRTWYRRLQMETMLPSFESRSDDAVFSTLDKTGMHPLNGDETLREKKIFIGEILRGQALFLPMEQTFIKRTLFGQELEMIELRVLGPEDEVARVYLSNDRVEMKTHFTRDGKLNFGGSTVQEELREGETEAFVAEPRFELHPDGLLRWVGCTCTAFSALGENGYGGPCAHLRALWLKYSGQIEAIREAKDAGEDVGPALVEERRWTKSKEERVVQIDVRRKYMLLEKWKRFGMTDFRQTTQVYSSEAKARAAYEKRCRYLHGRGFEEGL